MLISYISRYLVISINNYEIMKKRHEQKLVVLSIALLLVFNIPFVLIFNFEGAIFGIPTLYFSLFTFWMISIVISYIVLKRHYE